MGNVKECLISTETSVYGYPAVFYGQPDQAGDQYRPSLTEAWATRGEHYEDYDYDYDTPETVRFYCERLDEPFNNLFAFVEDVPAELVDRVNNFTVAAFAMALSLRGDGRTKQLEGFNEYFAVVLEALHEAYGFTHRAEVAAFFSAIYLLLDDTLAFDDEEHRSMVAGK